MRLSFSRLCLVTLVLTLLMSALGTDVQGRSLGIWKVPVQSRVIARTFEDGPAASTKPILDVLRQSDIPATFFVVGERAQQLPAIVAEEHAAGHEIENHGWNHTNLRRLNRTAVRQQIMRTATVIEQEIGRRPDFLRPPYGWANTVVSSEAARAGEQLVLWTVDSHDWSDPGVSRIVHNVVDHVRPGAIVLMHDAPESGQTVQALKQIIPILLHRGYRFVTLSNLVAMMGATESRQASLGERWRTALALTLLPESAP